jgi:hypothetical protein
MRDEMSKLFSDRFRGHESPVDPSVWEGVQQQMAASAAGAEDGVSKLFKERFQGHETAVDPSVWQGVNNQLGHITSTTGGSGLLGWAAAGTAVLVAGIAGFLFLSDTPSDIQHVEAGPIPELIQPTQRTGVSVAEPDQPPVGPITTTNSGTDHSRSAPIAVPKPADRVSRPAGPKTMATLPTDPVNDLRPALDPVYARAQDGPARVETIIQELTTEVENEVKARPEPERSEVSLVEDKPEESEQPSTAEDRTAAPELFMPNTFTPNGDGINDRYEVDMTGFKSLVLRVYSMKSDRLVFSTNGGEPWTGEGCEAGMYMVAVEAVTKDGKIISQGKVVWLTRDGTN